MFHPAAPRLAAFTLAAVLAALSVATTPSAAQSPLSAGGAVQPIPDSKTPAPLPVPDGAVSGMGDINIYPKRVVIDDHNRVASVGLFNRTVNTGEYDITVSDMMMREDGQLVDLASVSDPQMRARVHTASSFLRWSPHHVVLPGNQAQMVRIMAHVPPDLPPGEYRAHFTAVAVPPDDGSLSIEQVTGKQSATGIGVRITPRFGISIPVIVRVGPTSLTVGLTDIHAVTLPNGGRSLDFTLTRSGTRSAFGDITITQAHRKAPLAQLRGVGVYTEIDHRTVRLAFDAKTPADALVPGSILTITYTDDDAAPGTVLARQDFTMP